MRPRGIPAENRASWNASSEASMPTASMRPRGIPAENSQRLDVWSSAHRSARFNEAAGNTRGKRRGLVPGSAATMFVEASMRPRGIPAENYNGYVAHMHCVDISFNEAAGNTRGKRRRSTCRA